MSDLSLPEPIAKFIRRSFANQFQDLVSVRLQQRGVMRLAPDKPWVPFRAEQFISADKVEFEWVARVKLAPLLWAKVIDAFVEQHGRLKISLWGIIPIAGARGKQLDRGEIQRYLAELPWCPMALCKNSSLKFEFSGKDKVRVWVGERDTYVDLTFDAQGDIVSSRSETRERVGTGRQPWEGRFDNYTEIGGLRVPLRATVRWETPTGPFEYWRGEIVSLNTVTRQSTESQTNVA